MRDPTIDPQRGDIVKAAKFKNERERHVTARRGGDVDYLAVTAKSSVQKNCWISTWQDWCKKNEVTVVQAAPSGAVGDPAHDAAGSESA